MHTSANKTVLTHFYNEEYMLPWWLEHHKKIFNHGVLVDYNSTDNSVKIIKKICPTWEVVKTRNTSFEAVSNDRELMDIEDRIDGYKIVLTAMEFFCGDIDSLIKTEKDVYEIPQMTMVDIEETVLPIYKKSIIEQKPWGLFRGGNRYLHKLRNGDYTEGRHSIWKNTPFQHHTYSKERASECKIMWYRYSPWNEDFIKRKLQIKDKLSDDVIVNGMGVHHTWSREQMQNEWVGHKLEVLEQINAK